MTRSSSKVGYRMRVVYDDDDLRELTAHARPFPPTESVISLLLLLPLLPDHTTLPSSFPPLSPPYAHTQSPPLFCGFATLQFDPSTPRPLDPSRTQP